MELGNVDRFLINKNFINFIIIFIQTCTSNPIVLVVNFFLKNSVSHSYIYTFKSDIINIGKRGIFISRWIIFIKFELNYNPLLYVSFNVHCLIAILYIQSEIPKVTRLYLLKIDSQI